MLGVFLLGLLSPGPDFAVVIAQSLSGGRLCGIRTALGIAFGLCFHISFCVLGLSFVLEQSPEYFIWLKKIGGFYLIYMAYTLWKNHRDKDQIESIEDQRTFSIHSSFFRGFWTNILNPKATIFFVLIFSTMIPSLVEQKYLWIYGFTMVVLASIWFCTVAWFLNLSVLQKSLEKALPMIQLGTAFFLFFFGCSAVLFSS